MAAISRSGLTRVLTGVLVFFTVIQGAISQAPMTENSKAIWAAVLMFLVVGITAWNQYLSVEIRNTAIWPTVIIAVIATLGGLNDLVGAIPISLAMSQWVRLIISTLSTMLALFSKSLWPTPESLVIEETKSELTVNSN